MTITVMAATSRLGERVIRALIDAGQSPETIIAVVCLGTDHSQQTYELTGTYAYSMEELTETVRQITEFPIVYSPISIPNWIQKARQKGMNEYMIGLIASLYMAVESGEFEKVTAHVEELTGRPPETPELFIRRSLGRA
jgi:uncharacterized protein YbjT (DUF2867 family)